MSNGKLLFVEDEQPVLESLKRFFNSRGYEAQGAQTPEAAFDLINANQFDLAVLDVMLHESGGGDGEVDGFELCKNLREKGFDKPIIFVSARSSEEDKLLGFEMGADDYVTKPFSLPELEARVKVNLKRTRVVLKRLTYENNVVVDLDLHEIHHDGGNTIETLSKRERDLLAFFINNAGKVLSRDQLLQEVWDYRGGVATRTVDTHVLTVRKKLRDNIQNPIFIQTLHGVGYKFIAKPLSS